MLDVYYFEVLYTDPAQRFITAGQGLDYPDRDMSDVWVVPRIGCTILVTLGALCEAQSSSCENIAYTIAREALGIPRTIACLTR